MYVMGYFMIKKLDSKPNQIPILFQVWNEVEFEAALEDFQGLLCSDRLADKPECNLIKAKVVSKLYLNTPQIQNSNKKPHKIFLQENILPVQVQVYYETLCPYSIEFISQQLYPTFQNLGQYLDIEFIPYGNAQV